MPNTLTGKTLPTHQHLNVQNLPKQTRYILTSNLANNEPATDLRILYEMAERYAASHHDEIAASILVCASFIDPYQAHFPDFPAIASALQQPPVNPAIAASEPRDLNKLNRMITHSKEKSLPATPANTVDASNTPPLPNSPDPPDTPTHHLDEADWTSPFQWVRLKHHLVLRATGFHTHAYYAYHSQHAYVLRFLTQLHKEHPDSPTFSITDIQKCLDQHSSKKSGNTRIGRIIVRYLLYQGAITQQHGDNAKQFRIASPDIESYLHPRVIYDAQEYTYPITLTKNLLAKNPNPAQVTP